MDELAPLRSLMFVPGHRERMVQRALGLGEFEAGALDVAILDLEDGVPAASKDDARRILAAALAESSSGARSGSLGPLRFARVQAEEAARDADLEAVVLPGLAAVVAPKLRAAEDIEGLDRAIAARERSVGLPAGSVKIVASIESAAALVDAPRIAARSARVIALMFGSEDYALDLGLPTAREGEAAELLYARSATVVAAVASQKLAFDGIWPDIADAEGLRADSLRARQLGFTGKTLIHPGQIATVNEVFSPTAREIEEARRVVAAFEAAVARGEGAVALDGRLLDPPIVDRARRVLRTVSPSADR